MTDEEFVRDGGIDAVLRSVFTALVSLNVPVETAVRLHAAIAAKLDADPGCDLLFIDSFCEPDGQRNSRVVEQSSPDVVITLPLGQWREAWQREVRAARQSHPCLN